MKEYKIDLHEFEGKVREVVSEAIQRHAFELGYEWLAHGKKASYKGSPCLFFEKSGDVLQNSTMDGFTHYSNQLISAADFLALTPEDVKDADFLALTPEDVQDKPKEPEFKPFDRVLVRDDDDDEWHIDFFEGMNKDKDEMYRYQCLNSYWRHCIPYEGNEHLLGTTEAPK